MHYRYQGAALAAIEGPEQTERYARDEQGRVVEKAVSLRLNDGRWVHSTTRYRRDAQGLLAAQSLPDGSELQFERDGQGQGYVEDQVDDVPDPESAHHDDHQRQPADQSEVAAQVQDRQPYRRGVQQRRQHPRQDQVRLDVEVRHARQVAGPDPERDQQQGRRDARPPGEGDRDDRDDQAAAGDVEVLVLHPGQSRNGS